MPVLLSSCGTVHATGVYVNSSKFEHGLRADTTTALIFCSRGHVFPYSYIPLSTCLQLFFVIVCAHVVDFITASSIKAGEAVDMGYSTNVLTVLILQLNVSECSQNVIHSE
jgi:hypothetical protein